MKEKLVKCEHCKREVEEKDIIPILVENFPMDVCPECLQLYLSLNED